MKNYSPAKIRNIGIFGHAGSGKTALIDAMAFDSGAAKRLGKVDDGTSIADYLPEEIDKKATISTALVPIEWNKHKINILDTPGYADFVGEVYSVMRVVDNALLVLDAKSGVEVRTEIAWDMAAKKGIPVMAIVSKMDRENANFNQAVEQMREKFSGRNIVPLQIPIGEGENFKGIIDVLKKKAYVYDGNGGKFNETGVPAEYQDDLEMYYASIAEAAAEADDELLMKFLEEEPLTEKEVNDGLCAAIKDSKAVPVLCGSGLNNIAVPQLLDSIIDFMPSPEQIEGDKKGESLAAFIYKTLSDPFVGKLSFVRVYQGVLNGDTKLYNSNKEIEEKVGKIYFVQGKEQFQTEEISAGDFGAIVKLQETATGDTFCIKEEPVTLEGIDFPEHNYSLAVEPATKADVDKMGHAIIRLLEEDPTLSLERHAETKENVLSGIGDTQLDVVVMKLKQKFGVEVITKTPLIPYRETIRTKVEIEGKHKKQSGGHGQYGHVWLRMSPNDNTEENISFSQEIFGGSVPRNYFPAVEKGVKEASEEGALAGYPVTNVKVVLYDGSYHPVDSSEMAFKIATVQGFKKGMEKAQPILLEPLMNVDITVPDYNMGDIVDDLNTKRGRILGMEPKDGHQVIKAQVPLSEMMRYAIDLKSITQGRGVFHMEFAQYEEVPARIADQVIEQARKDKEEA